MANFVSEYLDWNEMDSFAIVHLDWIDSFAIDMASFASNNLDWMLSCA